MTPATGNGRAHGGARLGSARSRSRSIPRAQYAYVTLYGAKKVLQYTIAPDGRLTGDGTPVVLTGNDPWPVAIDPTGQYAYWSNIFDDKISQYTIGAGGAL